MIHLLSVTIAFAAFLALAVSMKRHQRDLAGRTVPPAQARMARITGWLLLALAWTIEAILIGPAMGTIVWLGELSLAAALTVCTINWKTRATR